MRYIKSYSSHNEGIKKSLLKAGIASSILLNSPEIHSMNSDSVKVNKDGTNVHRIMAPIPPYINNLSKIRAKNSTDSKLNDIIDEIKENINSQDTTKFIEMFDKLSAHLEDKYKYKVEVRKMEDLDTSNVDKNVFAILGWLGSLCLAICGVPQALMSYRDKHSHGISWGFLLLWAFGELFALAYVYDKLDLPLLVNYAVNILIVGVILYFKIKPIGPPQE